MQYTIIATGSGASVRYAQIEGDDIALAKEEFGPQEIIDRGDWEETFCYEVRRHAAISVVDEDGEEVFRCDTIDNCGCTIKTAEKDPIGNGLFRGDYGRRSVPEVGKCYAFVEDWESTKVEFDVECEGEFDIKKFALTITQSGYVLDASYGGEHVSVDRYCDDEEDPEPEESYYYVLNPETNT